MTAEGTALANILAWSADSPGWQRDVLRRLATQAVLEPTEVDELTSICKGDKQAVPLAAGHLLSPNFYRSEVYLRQVHGFRHVNALAPDQRLTLHRVGLTIIYGDNGSGKSGYARILKKVCRARMPSRAEEIIPDIYDTAPGSPSATIEYGISGQNRTCVWQLGQAADTALSDISVFDSRTADVHVDDTNDVAYTPFPLKLLGALAQLCKSVKDKLAAEIAPIKAQTPEAIEASACSRETEVGKPICAFPDEPLPQIGSEVWQALWASARAFSDAEAYPGGRFPVTGPGSVCVLCQQELTPVAADRLNRFEAFVRDDSQQRAAAARIAYDRALATFKGEAVSLTELANIVATVRDELGLDDLALEIRGAILRALWRHRKIRRRHASPGAAIDVPVPEYPRQALVDQAAGIEARAIALAAEADSPARTALLTEKDELVDRQWLGGIKSDVLAEIERQKNIALPETAQRDTATNRVTTRSTEIAQALVTNALRARFAREVASFEIAGLAVELRQQNSVQGIPRYKVAYRL